MNVWLWLLSCTLKNSGASQKPQKNIPVHIVEEQPIKATGVKRNEKFYDYKFPFSAVIPIGWEIDPQPENSSLRLRLKHPQKTMVIEVWHFEEIILKPTKHDFCTWTFVDRGLYDLSSEEIIVGTCIPDNSEAPFVFAYIRHWKGSWQFEIQVAQDQYIEEKKQGERIISQFYWSDDVDIPALKP